MSISFGSSLVQIVLDWTPFEANAVTKNLVIQYHETNSTYIIFGLDGSVVYICTLYKGSVPDAPGFNQNTNDADKTDFETNYKPGANGVLGPNSVHSHNFTTMTPLSAGGIFTGAGEDVSGFVNADISIFTDQPSIPNGLVFSWSQDNITFGYSESFSVLPNSGQYFSLAPRAKYFKVSYTNGPIAQGVFQLTTAYYPVSRSTYAQNASNDIPSGKAVDVVKSILAAKKEGGNVNSEFTNLQATSTGVLKVAVQTAIVPATGAPTVTKKSSVGPVSAAAAVNCPFTGSLAAGNTIIVMVMQGDGTFGATYSVADNRGNLYTKTGGVNLITVGTVDAWYASNILGGATTVSVVGLNSTVNIAVQAYEVSGLNRSTSPADNITAGLSLVPVTSLSGGTLATSKNNELVVTAIAATGGGVITAGAGWTQDFSSANFLSETQIAAAPSSVAGTAAASAGVTYIGLMVSFAPIVTSLPLATDAAGRLISIGLVQDGSGNPITSSALASKQRLDVDGPSDGAIGSPVPSLAAQSGARDPAGNLRSLNLDTFGNLLVSTTSTSSPSGATTVSQGGLVALGNNATVDSLYVIPSGKTLIIQILKGRFSSGSGTGAYAQLSLYEDPNGNLSTLNLIDTIFGNGNNFDTAQNGSVTYAGNGTRRILLRTVTSGNGFSAFRQWSGYYI